MRAKDGFAGTAGTLVETGGVETGGAETGGAETGGLDLAADPFDLARGWLEEAAGAEINDPNAIALATVDSGGLPNVRMVLLKEIDGKGAAGGFVFYTNAESAKGAELLGQGKAAFVAHWKSLRRQVRARGLVERVSPEESDAYFRSRAYQSRIGAWASRQSRPLESRAALIAEAERYAALYPENPPRPPYWGGFRLRPLEIELWRDGEFRLHDRFLWRRESVDSGEWRATRLNP
ncbi:pyridoxamine 5'-phosphate oxidase [Neomegalonema perideroedes]|uniref:pyridoxamine 5'-phosphate oxidase n=1 Tax=Neomegalonema perideroedes TaxID=217219 RepID=UPI0003763B94|nr:pyridoxamine 5'-phosphate oxidase [Neomegalonema perideroedes]